jgi:hypothetical protein
VKKVSMILRLGFIFDALDPLRLTSSRLRRQQTPSIVSLDVHLSRHDLIVQAVYTADMFIRQDCEREVDQEDQSNGRVQEVREESGFEAADSGINDNYNKYKSASNSHTIQHPAKRSKRTYLQQGSESRPPQYAFPSCPIQAVRQQESFLRTRKCC